ncbi:MAG: bile acid:sodium symporter family protein [Planctomycetota bacterium]|nr:bile acid:sodium symporter family protein [Planctomycetota bacterium]
MVQRFLLPLLVLTSLLAYFWPADWIDPFSKEISRYYLDWLIVITMFSIGWMLPRNELDQVARRWKTVLGGVLVQYATMPLLALGCGLLFQLQGDYLLGMVLVGCVPGAMASNVLTINARGNASYSVSLTTVATLLSPLAVPLAMRLVAALLGGKMDLLEQAAGDGVYARSSVKLCYTVVAPVIAGFLAGRIFSGWERRARQLCPLIANLAILAIIAVVVGRTRTQLEDLPLKILAALLLLNLAGYTAGHLAARTMKLPDSMGRALTLEIGMQNAGVGTLLALTLFTDTSAIPPAFYTFGCMFTGTILAGYWRKREQKEEQ